MGAAYTLAGLLSVPWRQRTPHILFANLTWAIGVGVYALTIPAEPRIETPLLPVSIPGARVGADAMLRLLGLLGLGTLTTRWIPARDLLPLVARRPFPFYLAASLIRIVPTLRADFERVRLAQTARGLDVKVRGRRAALALFVPLFVTGLRRAREQAIAAELAGLAPRRGRA